MFVAMNRFRIAPGAEADFEEMWRSRDSQLDKVEGFLAFKLLKGPAAEDHTLYVSHSMWRDRAAFEAWTRSPHFRRAHATAGSSKPMYLGPPQFEGFESVVEA
jgi:heme-degrading monooxygenase HmoA